MEKVKYILPAFYYCAEAMVRDIIKDGGKEA